MAIDVKKEEFAVSDSGSRKGCTEILVYLEQKIEVASEWTSFATPRSHVAKSRLGWSDSRANKLAKIESQLISLTEQLRRSIQEIANLAFRRSVLVSGSVFCTIDPYNQGFVRQTVLFVAEHSTRSQKIVDGFAKTALAMVREKSDAIRQAMLTELVERDALIRDAEIDSKIHSTVDAIRSAERGRVEMALGAEERRKKAFEEYRANLEKIERDIAGEIASRRPDSITAILHPFKDEMLADIGPNGVEMVRKLALSSEIEEKSPGYFSLTR